MEVAVTNIAWSGVSLLIDEAFAVELIRMTGFIETGPDSDGPGSTTRKGV
jgi:hypothetical protein